MTPPTRRALQSDKGVALSPFKINERVDYPNSLLKGTHPPKRELVEENYHTSHPLCILIIPPASKCCTVPLCVSFRATTRNPVSISGIISPKSHLYRRLTLKNKPAVLSVLFLIFAFLPPISKYGVEMDLSFEIWFMLTIIYTFLFIGIYQLIANNSIGIIVMALFVCLGLFSFTSLKGFTHIGNFYVMYPILTGSLTTLITEKILKNYRS